MEGGRKVGTRRSFPCGRQAASGTVHSVCVRDGRPLGGRPTTGFRFAASPARRATPTSYGDSSGAGSAGACPHPSDVRFEVPNAVVIAMIMTITTAEGPHRHRASAPKARPPPASLASITTMPNGNTKALARAAFKMRNPLSQLLYHPRIMGARHCPRTYQVHVVDCTSCSKSIDVLVLFHSLRASISAGIGISS